MSSTLLEQKASAVTLPVIPPQGGYAAKTCPRKLSNENDVFYADAPRDPLTAATQQRIDDGVRFENEVAGAWSQALGDRIALLDGDRSEEAKAARERRTIELMESPGEVLVIWNARLPVEHPATGELGSRISEPDFLVRSRYDDTAGRWYWSPGDVKHHKVFENLGKSTRDWIHSTLAEPRHTTGVARDLPGVVKRSDALQLAHYQRHLEWLGFADDRALGAVIGKADTDGNLSLVWLSLSEKLYDRSKASAFELYDASFDFAGQVIARAIARSENPTLAPLVRPDKRSECGECIWRTVCADDRRDADNITALPGVTVARAQVHYERGVTTIGRLARLHVPTAQVVAGERSADSVERLDPFTFSYTGTKVWDLVGTIDQARVWRSGKPHRVRGVDAPSFDRMPIELDIDIEDIDGRVYLIGVNASGRARKASGDSKSRNEFHSFVSWDDTDESQARVLAEFWEYIETMRSYARSNHWGLRAYHYGPHEVSMLTKVAARFGGQKVGRKLTVPTVEELTDLFDSNQWVDMYPVVSRQVLWPTEDLTLKSIATLCGHTWRDTDPSGANSMAWYRDAVTDGDSAERRAARSRILAYNEDDCIATLAIRDWLTRATAANLGKGLPGVEDLDTRFAQRYL